MPITMLVMLIKRGEGVQQDSQKALKWLELAAEYQMSGAASELAEIYRDGIGNVSQNLEKAQAFYLLAKEAGENVERSVQQLRSRLAVRDNFDELLEQAKEGNLEAQKDLAMAYVRGDEIEQKVHPMLRIYNLLLRPLIAAGYLHSAQKHRSIPYQH